MLFFDSWAVLGRTLLIGMISYVALVGFLRVMGKRTLSKWNAFDFIVTIALGSTLASVIISKDVALLQGLVALLLLVLLQYGVTWSSVRWRSFQKFVKSTPALLLYRGEFLEAALRRERVTASEVRAAVRQAGHPAVEDIGAVVLETDGSISILKDLGRGEATALEGVRGFPPERPWR